jgi:two-component system chemotaxis response regulator CheY
MHALVVDDSRTTRLILKALLRQLGYEVSEAGSAREAFDHLLRSPETALVLVDWNMPEVDGVALVSALRADGRFADLPVLMVSGEEDAGHTAAAVRAGANGFVSKPFTKDAIRAQLEVLGIGQA